MIRSFVKVLFISLLAFSIPTMLRAAGTTGGEILKTPFGARANAMGEASSAVQDDVNVMHYNPASLGSLSQREIQTMYLDGLIDSSYLFLGYGHPLGKGALAASILYFDGGDIELGTLSGSTITTETKKAQQDFLGTLGYGHKVTNHIHLGLNLKVLHSTLVEDFTATAFAADLGIQYQTPIKLILAGAIQNMGTELKYDQEGDPLPFQGRLGASYPLSLGQANQILGAIDLVLPKDTNPKINMGLEYQWKSLLALRTGYKLDTEETSEQIMGITAGIGFKWNVYFLDYSFGLVEDLNDKHVVSLGARF